MCVLPAVALADSDDRAWYLVRGNSGECSPLNAGPTAYSKLLQQQPGGVLRDEHGRTIADKNEVPGVIERVLDDGKGHFAGTVFAEGGDACRSIAEPMRATYSMPEQQRARKPAP